MKISKLFRSIICQLVGFFSLILNGLPLYSMTASQRTDLQMARPGIVHAKAHLRFSAKWEDVNSPKIAFPIPVEFSDQVPIYIEFSSEPQDHIVGITYKKRDKYNWIAEVTLKSLKKGEYVDIKWDGYVFIRDHDYSKLPEGAKILKTEELSEEMRQWLVPTTCVQVNDTEIQEAAVKIKGKHTDIMKIARETAKFLGSIERGRSFKSLDAVEALHNGGSCTSYANLAAALLRANGIPTRILACYPTWEFPLCTHYIVEFYVPEYGWIRFESTRSKIPWKPYKDVIVAVVRPEDENRSLNESMSRWAMNGVPWMSLEENLSHSKMDSEGKLGSERYYIHAAEPLLEINAEENKIEEAFALTKKAWNIFMRNKTRGIDNKKMIISLKEAIESHNIEEYIQRIKNANTESSQKAFSLSLASGYLFRTTFGNFNPLPNTADVPEIVVSLENISASFGLSLGYVISERFELQGTFSYGRSKIMNDVGIGIAGIPLGKNKVSYVKNLTYAGNILIHFPLKRISPFITAGLGAITLNPEKLRSSTKLLVIFGAGVKYELSRHLSMFFNIKDYISFFNYPEDFDVSYIAIYAPDFKKRQHRLGIHIGLSYLF